jgi:hypothetical protein
VSTSRRQSTALAGIRIEAPPPPLVFPHSTVSCRSRDLCIKLAASLTPTVLPELWEHSASPLATTAHWAPLSPSRTAAQPASPLTKLLGELPPPRRCSVRLPFPPHAHTGLHSSPRRPSHRQPPHHRACAVHGDHGVVALRCAEGAGRLNRFLQLGRAAFRPAASHGPPDLGGCGLGSVSVQ